MKRQSTTRCILPAQLRWRSAGRLALAIALTSSLCGCHDKTQSTTRIATFPVKGTLSIDGAPAAGAMVKFYSKKQGGRVPTAIVHEDGSFSASFYDNEDGSPAGQYDLLVVWMQPPPGGGLAQDRLRGQFLDPSKPVASITVIPGNNQIPPIELVTKPP